jgi:hypothetical protein
VPSLLLEGQKCFDFLDPEEAPPSILIRPISPVSVGLDLPGLRRVLLKSDVFRGPQCGKITYI